MGDFHFSGMENTTLTVLTERTLFPDETETIRAILDLREKKDVVPEEIISLRETVDELRKENEELSKDVEDIKKRLDAQEEAEEEEDD